MNRLKAILYGTYVILIMLLLIFGLRYCNRTQPNIIHIPDNPVLRDSLPEPEPEPEQPTNQEQNREAIERAEDVGESGDLKVTLLWDFYSDIDLHVIEPNRNEIYYGNKRSRATGGFLDVDNTAGGRNSAENIFWENPPAGKYIVKLKYYEVKQDHGGKCTVVVKQAGKEPRTYDVQMSRSKEVKHVVDIIIE